MADYAAAERAKPSLANALESIGAVWHSLAVVRHKDGSFGLKAGLASLPATDLPPRIQDVPVDYELQSRPEAAGRASGWRRRANGTRR